MAHRLLDPHSARKKRYHLTIRLRPLYSDYAEATSAAPPSALDVLAFLLPIFLSYFFLKFPLRKVIARTIRERCKYRGSE